MVLAIILILIVIASVLFHIFSPWHATPLASNWGTIDDTITITVVITGVFFIAIGLFMAYAVIRYRHRKGNRAHYEPENKKLEWILIAITTIGVCGLLAPGLFVYGNFVRVPADASEFEAVGRQWRWSFRLPGEDGTLGKTDIGFINGKNPFGIDPNDPNGQDDRLVNKNEIHIPIGQPVKVLLRSKDVLHDFYVPHFRVKMDAVPGLVSYMWFKPTRVGKYEILCSELCGVGHYNMRGHVIVDDAQAYRQWLNALPTFSETLRGASLSGLVEQGLNLSESQGCFACHSVDGSKSVGPGWQGLYGTREQLADGSTITVDADYLKESILKPNAKIVNGYPPVMVAYDLSDQQLDAIVAYIKYLQAGSAPAAESEAREIPQPQAKRDALEDQGLGLEETLQEPAEVGRRLAQSNGCFACHSMDGSKSVGPSWKNLYGKTETLADGSTVVVNDDYFKESILKPNAKIVKGYPPLMVPYQFNEKELQELIAFAKSVSDFSVAEAPTVTQPEDGEE